MDEGQQRPDLQVRYVFGFVRTPQAVYAARHQNTSMKSNLKFRLLKARLRSVLPIPALEALDSVKGYIYLLLIVNNDDNNDAPVV